MANLITDALDLVGVNLSGDPAADAGNQISSFNEQNLSPGDIFGAINKIPQTVGGLPGVGSRIPGLGKIPLPTSQISNILGIPNALRLGTGGTWQSPLYGKDLNRHHPKFKFLFKVHFEGFIPESPDKNFYYFVHRCDKPRVRFNHMDVNYYNFRTRVLTSVTYEPLTVTFLDEIGNSINDFFTRYLQTHSGTGNGHYGIDRGFGMSTSSKNYSRGYSTGRVITLEQIFANGTLTNRFRFINPRIEAFDFDELAMDDTTGSMMTATFSYDAIECMTVVNEVRYAWGETDLHRGGGTSGAPNAGATSRAESGLFPNVFASGGGIGGAIGLPKTPGIAAADLLGGKIVQNSIPQSLSDLVSPSGSTGIQGGSNLPIGSSGDIVSKTINDTLSAISSGKNLIFGGKQQPSTTADAVYQVGSERTITSQNNFNTPGINPISTTQKS